MIIDFSYQRFVMILLFILGLIFGSFGSVLITRSSWKSIVFGRSECSKCHHQLKRYHLFPLVSFIYQKGRCSYCKQSISWKYVILEVGSAIIFVTTFFLLQLYGNMERSNYLLWIVSNRLLFLLVLFDIEKLELHVPLRVILLLLSIGFQIMTIKRVLISLLIFGGSFYLLYFMAKYYVRKKYQSNYGGIGEGDAMLAGVIGALIPAIFTIHHITISGLYLREMFVLFLILSSILGLLFSLLQLVLHKGVQQKIGRKQHLLVPFIPAMILALRILLISAPKLLLFMFPR